MIVDLASFLRRYYLAQYLGHFHWFGYTDRDLPAVARLSKQQLKQVRYTLVVELWCDIDRAWYL
jgi:hypothetical protein